MLISQTIALAENSKRNKPRGENAPVLFKLPVWVRNGPTQFKTGLMPEDFRVLCGKSSIEVCSLNQPESPTFLFIAFDTVGDIANINQARNALVDELKRLGSQYWAGLISAQEQITVVRDPTPDREMLRQGIQALTQIGKAGLLESIQSLADFTTGLLLRSNVRVAVILITDSDIGNYRADYLNPPVNASDSRDLSRRFAGRALQETLSRITTSLSRCQAPIFIVHIDPRQDPLNKTYQNGLKQLAGIVGGQLLLSKTMGDIPLTIHEAFQWVQSFYVLSLQVSRAKRGIQRIQISLSDREQASQGVSGRLIYPSRLFFP